jgi:hypothetical protein
VTGSGRAGRAARPNLSRVEGRVTGRFRGVLTNVMAVAGLLATMFYIMTAMAATVYYGARQSPASGTFSLWAFSRSGRSCS